MRHRLLGLLDGAVLVLGLRALSRALTEARKGQFDRAFERGMAAAPKRRAILLCPCRHPEHDVGCRLPAGHEGDHDPGWVKSEPPGTDSSWPQFYGARASG